MSFIDKIKNRLRMAKGHGKEQAGRAAGDPYLKGEGRAERARGGAGQAGEHVKDAGKSVRDAFKK